MSAGMTCAIDVVFRPAVNEDVITEIPVLCETGPIMVPLLCTTKKVVPTLDTHDVYFGDHVVIGEETTIHLHIRNGGALSTRYELFDKRTGEAPVWVGGGWRLRGRVGGGDSASWAGRWAEGPLPLGMLTTPSSLPRHAGGQRCAHAAARLCQRWCHA